MKRNAQNALTRKKILLTALILSFLGLSVAYGMMLEMNRVQPALAPADTLPTIVIDPGHGEWFHTKSVFKFARSLYFYGR